MAREILSTNLDLLARIDTHLVQRVRDIIESSSSHPSFKGGDGTVEEIFIDLALLAHTNCVILYGLENQALLKQIIESTSESVFILVIEPSLLFFSTLLSTVDYTFALQSKRITFSVEEQPMVAVRHNMERYFGIVTQQNYTVIKNPFSVAHDPDFYEKIDDAIGEIKENAARNRATLKEFSQEWQKHVMKNLCYLASCHGIKKLFNAFHDKPAVVISAGPSLDKNIKWLRSLEKKAVIIAVDSAYRSLVANQVRPDFLVCLDSQPDNYLHLEEVQSAKQEVVLVMNPVTFPEVPKSHQGAIVNMAYNIPVINWLEDAIGDLGETLVGGSVSTSAFDFARKMGCDPIILVGQDLSYEGNRSYTSECYLSKLQEDKIEKKTTLSFLQSTSIQNSKERDVRNLFGGIVATNAKMVSWKKWLESMSHSSQCINSTEAGLKLLGYKVLPLHLSSFLHCEDVLLKKEKIERCLAGRTEVDYDALGQKLEGYRSVLQDVRSICQKAGKSAMEVSTLLSSGEDGIKKAKCILQQLQIFSQEILSMDHFVQIHHWEVEFLLEEVNAKQRKEQENTTIDSLILKNAHIYRYLFEEVAEIAEQGGRCVNIGIASLKEGLTF